MDSFVKADIFFFVSTICFFVIAILTVWFLIYAISIAKDVKKLSRRIEREGERIADDLEQFRNEAKGRVLGVSRILGTIFGGGRKKK